MKTEDRPAESSFAPALPGNCVTEPCHIVNAVAGPAGRSVAASMRSASPTASARRVCSVARSASQPTGSPPCCTKAHIKESQEEARCAKSLASLVRHALRQRVA